MAIQLVVLAATSALCLAPELHGVWEAGGAPGLAAWSQGLPWPTLVYMGVATTALTLWIEIEAMKKVTQDCNETTGKKAQRARTDPGVLGFGA